MPGMIAELPDEGTLLRTVIDKLLEEQQQLTAVERFSRRHEAHAVPAHSRYYRDLIPRTKPGEGQQYAFGVDLDACTGCKGCVSACHSLNGLDDDELWRNVGLLHSGTSAYQQTVTTACHHCVDPACMNGCPVLAYDKDPKTGIVRHLDDQCIGCQYCVLKCPYEVPKYSKARGIVRKCDMCSARLAEGEAPACVQACPNGAITIGLIDRAALTVGTRTADRLLPGTVSSAYALPTTTYRTRRSIPADAAAGDAGVFRLQEAHWPLVFMLVFSQMSVGIFAALAALPVSGGAAAALAVTGAGLLHLGLAASVFHLGKPLGAWRAFLGLRRSWMSREIVAFGGLAGIASACAALHSLPFVAPVVPATAIIANLIPYRLGEGLAVGAALLGLLAIYCSAMIYIDTQRPCWAAGHTVRKFFGTAALLGIAGAAGVLAWMDVVSPGGYEGVWQALMLAAVGIHCVLFGVDVAWLTRGLSTGFTYQHRAARALWLQRQGAIFVTAALFCSSTLLALAALIFTGLPAALSATASLGLTIGAQIIDRYFYFVASEPFRMPGPVPIRQEEHS